MAAVLRTPCTMSVGSFLAALLDGWIAAHPLATVLLARILALLPDYWAGQLNWRLAFVAVSSRRALLVSGSLVAFFRRILPTRDDGHGLRPTSWAFS